MLPHEKTLVKRLAGEPFALIGMNTDSDSVEKLRHPLATCLRRCPSQDQWVLDVLVGAQHRQEIEVLKDESDGPGAKIRESIVRELVDLAARDLHRSAIGPIDATDHIEQGRLSAP